MTNDELKKKIAQIIADYFCPQRNEHKNLWGDDRLCYSKMNFAECERVTECTDALIAAGIGDVRAAEHSLALMEKALEILVKNNRPCEDCQARRNGECRMFDEERKECAMPSLAFYKQLAEKELAEERKDDSRGKD